MNVLHLAIFVGLLESDSALGLLGLRHRARAIERQAIIEKLKKYYVTINE